MVQKKIHTHLSPARKRNPTSPLIFDHSSQRAHFFSPRITRIARAGLIVLLSTFLTVTLVRAGTLTPSASPAATSFTLSDLSTRLTTNATSTSGNHTFTAPSSVTTTLSSLTDLYNLIPTILPATVVSGTSYLGITGTYNTANLATSTVATGTIFGAGLSGFLFGDVNAALVSASATYAGTFITANLTTSTVATGTTFGVSQTGALFGSTSSSQVCSTGTYAGTLNPATSSIGVGNSVCGVSGTLLQNLFEGTGQGVTGGSQASGGVDDGNSLGSAPTDRYAALWTACAAGNSYCGTGLTSADAQDIFTGLVWSLPCNGAGCDSFSDSSPITYAWASSTTNANNFSATQNATTSAMGLCQSGDHGEAGWFLPHQKQLLQLYIDGGYGNLEATGVSRSYWSATTKSSSTSNAIVLTLGTGAADIAVKITDANYVRCIR